MTHHVIEITAERWIDRGPTYPQRARQEPWIKVRTLEHPAPEWWPATARELVATRLDQP